MSHQIGGDTGPSRGWWAASAVTVATLLIAAHDLVLGRVTAIFDALNFFYPYYVLVADHARAGGLLLWDPWLSGGAPSGFDQTGAFSPLTVTMAWLTGPSEGGFRAYWLVLWALGGLGVLPLARHLGAPSWAGCLAAIGWMFGGVFVGQAQLTPAIYSMAFLPWIVWRFDAAITRPSGPAAVQAGALWGLSALGGYPALTILTAGFVLIWGAGRVLCPPQVVDPGRRPPGIRRLLGSMTAFLVVGTVACAPTYLGFLVETKGYTQRSGPLDRATAVESNALHPYAVATLASPLVARIKLADQLGTFDGADGSIWSYTDATTSSLYLSPMLALLAVLSPMLASRDRFRWFLWGLALFCLASAMGRALPVRGWLYDVLPPMRYFRHASIIRGYFLFTIVALALLACRDLASTPPDRARARWRGLMMLALVGTPLAAAAMAATYAATGYPYLPKRALLHFAVAWPGLACAAAVGWLGGEAIARRVLPAMLIGLAGLDAVLTVDISASLISLRDPALIQRLGRTHSGDLDLTDRGLDRAFGFGGNEGMNTQVITKEPTLFGYSPMMNEFHLGLEDEPVLRRSALGPDRIWFSAAASEVEWTAERFDQLVAASRRLGRPCLFVTDPDSLRDGPPTAGVPPSPAEKPAEPVPVVVRGYRPRELVLDVTCPEDGWLLVTDRWAPGWRVRVDGEPQKLWIGNFVFRTVRVGEGPHRVAFSYHPFGYPWLLLASWTTLAAVGLHAAWARFASRSSRRSDDGRGRPGGEGRPEQSRQTASGSASGAAVGSASMYS